MNIWKILSIALLAGLAFSCSDSGEDDLLIGHGTIKLNLKKQMEVSLKTSEVGDGDLSNDYYGIQVYEKEESAGDDMYKPKCLGLFTGDHLDNMEIDTDKGKVYKICCAALISGERSWAPGMLNAPFSFGGDISELTGDNLNKFKNSNTYEFNELASPGLYRGAMRYYYCSTNRYYGEVKDVKDNAGNVDLICKINFIKITFKAAGLQDGKYVRVSIRNNNEPHNYGTSSEVRFFSKSQLESEDGITIDYNLFSYDFTNTTGEDIYLLVQSVDTTLDAPFDKDKGVIHKMRVSRKTAYNVFFDFNQALNITLEGEDDFTSVDGGTIAM